MSSDPAATALRFGGFDFGAAVTAPFRMQPGLRRPPAGTPQLTPLAPGSRHQREKLAVLSAFPEQALRRCDGFEAGPALKAVATHAAHEHPYAWRFDGERAEALLLGTAVDVAGTVSGTAPGRFGMGDEVPRCLAGLPAEWRFTALLALAFAEDLAILDGRSGTLPWLAVTLPSHWAPEEKIGRHFTAVHAPVADNALLMRAAESLIRLVTQPGPWERFVWSIGDHTRLHAHPARVDPLRWPRTPGEPAWRAAWFRSERQTFIALPEHGQAVFTIAVNVLPLAAVAADAERAAALRAALVSMSDEVLAYRGLAPVRDELVVWLAERGGPVRL